MTVDEPKSPPSSSSPSGTGSFPFPIPPTFPPGVNPETYKIDEVTSLLNRAAFFSLFSIPNPNRPNNPFPAQLPFPLGILSRLPFFSDLLLSGVSVNEAPRRFLALVEARGQDGFVATNQAGEEIATVHIDWYPIPWNYDANPDQPPPQKIFNPIVSQRFEMLNGQFRFADTSQSGFHGFGAGRTFPKFPDGLKVRIGAVINILKGFGELEGFVGTVVVNGEIAPPRELALSLMVRIVDPRGDFLTEDPLPALNCPGSADPGAVFMMFKGEADPSHPVQLRISPDGAILGSSVYERLRLIDIDFAIKGAEGLKSKVTEGRVVGDVSATLHFNPLDRRSVIPIQTTDGIFRFSDEAGRTIGTISSDMVEGRAFPTLLSEAPMPVFRFGGFGPIKSGTGVFADSTGMMSMNSIVSVFPRTLSNLYIFRLDNHTGRFLA